MHECMRRFRKTSSDEKSLECFAMLMTVTGKELDKEKTKVCDATVCKVSGTMTSQIMSSPRYS